MLRISPIYSYIDFICGLIDWIPSFKVAAVKGDQQCATMWVISMEDRDATHLQEVMLTIPSWTQEAPASLQLQLLSIVDQTQCSILLPVLQLINLVVRTIIDYNDNQSKTHCI